MIIKKTVPVVLSMTMLFSSVPAFAAELPGIGNTNASSESSEDMSSLSEMEGMAAGEITTASDMSMPSLDDENSLDSSSMTSFGSFASGMNMDATGFFNSFSSITFDNSDRFDMSRFTSLSDYKASTTNFVFDYSDIIIQGVGSMPASLDAISFDSIGVFEQNFGNLLDSSLTMAQIPEGFTVDAMLSYGNSMVNAGYSDFMSTSGFEATKSMIGSANIFEQAAAGPKQFKMDSYTELMTLKYNANEIQKMTADHKMEGLNGDLAGYINGFQDTIDVNVEEKRQAQEEKAAIIAAYNDGYFDGSDLTFDDVTNFTPEERAAWLERINEAPHDPSPSTNPDDYSITDGGVSYDGAAAFVSGQMAMWEDNYVDPETTNPDKYAAFEDAAIQHPEWLPDLYDEVGNIAGAAMLERAREAAMSTRDTDLVGEIEGYMRERGIDY